jgi:hypothetical protein
MSRERGRAEASTTACRVAAMSMMQPSVRMSSTLYLSLGAGWEAI